MKEILYSSGEIGTCQLKNRLIMPPANLSYCTEDGKITDAVIDFYRRRATGGAGLLVVGAAGVDPRRINTAGMMQICRDEDMEGMAALADAVHAAGGKAFPQLMHPGAYAKPGEYGGQTPIAPSEYFCGFTHVKTRALEPDEIAELVACFGTAARRAQLCGFDGVELAGSAGYLIAEFLSSATNHRTDRYGGDLTGRMTFLREIVADIRRRCGGDFPVMVRLAGNDMIPGGNGISECCQIAAELEMCGVDAVSVTGGWHETVVPQVTMDVPHGAYTYLARAVKQCISLPVVACNRMTVPLAEELLRRGDADFVGFCRGFIADPELANKATAGREDLIRPCIGCNQGCMDNIFRSRPLRCLTNARVAESAAEQRSDTPQNILVVGAGAAGLEFAARAAERGHRVTLWEAKDRVGGQLELAAAAPGHGSFREFADYLLCDCRTAGVEIVCGKEATAVEITSAVRNGDFGRVVLATGAEPAAPDFPTEEGARVVRAWDVLSGTAETGRDVVVIGGGGVGIGAALKLAQEGTIDAETLKFLFLYHVESPETLEKLLTTGSKHVTLAEMQSKLGTDIGPSSRWIALGQLKRFGVATRTATRVVEIRKDAVLAETADGEQICIPADTVVTAVGSRSVNALAAELKGKVPVTVIGDARSPRKLMDAVADADALAESV